MARVDGQESLWSALEVKTQAAQCTGQVDIWDALDEVGEIEPYADSNDHPDAWQVLT